MPNERQKNNDLRSEIKQQYPTMEVVPLIDAPKSNKKPYDWFTVMHYSDGQPPRFLAWEAKKVDGLSFNFKDISTGQMEAHQRYNKIYRGKYIIAHIFVLYLTRFNCIAVLDPVNVRYILHNDNPSVKFLDTCLKEDRISYKGKVRGYGWFWKFRREKVDIVVNGIETKKTLWNIRPFIDTLIT